MLKYCLVDSAIKNEDSIPTGVRQWATAFSGKTLTPDVLLDANILNEFDIVHIKLLPANYELVANIKKMIHVGSKTKIILSLDEASENCAAIFINRDELKTCCAHADLIFATHYLSVIYLEEIVNKKVYELYHPINFLKIPRSSSFEKTITILRDPEKNNKFNRLSLKFFCLFYKLYDFKHLFKYKIEIIERPEIWSEDFQKQLIHSEFIFCPDEKNNYGEDLFYAGASGCKIFGSQKADIIRRCFSLACSENWFNLKSTLIWFLASQEASQFFLEHASEKMEYYNFYNSKKRLLNILKHENLIDAADCSFDANDNDRVNYFADIKIISGPKDVRLDQDDFSVVCLEKNGYEYLPSFLNHYRELGAKHFFFIDNDSDDDTVSILSAQKDVTIYHTSLKHRKYESEIRRVIVDEHCKGSWCMCVDIDELFDFPHSNKISTKNLIEYLRINNFTSIVGYMLDMFSINDNTQGSYLEKVYTHYDISNIKKVDYFSAFHAFNGFNIISNEKVGLYYGGVRQAYVGKKSRSEFLLVKHPLFYVDHHIEPVSMPHFCNKTRVADISCVLKHYKLTFSLKEKINTGVEKDDYSYMIKDQIDAYKHMTGNADTIIGSMKAQKYIGTDELVTQKFIHITQNYESFVAHKIT